MYVVSSNFSNIFLDPNVGDIPPPLPPFADVCLLTFLQTYLITLLTDLRTYLLTYLFTYWPTNWLTDLLIY